MKWVGAHVSAAGGVENSPQNARKIGARSFAFFTKNQKQWRSPPLGDVSVESFKSRCERFGYDPDRILPHTSYLINLGSPDPEGLARSRAALVDEMARCRALGLTMLNFHPGSHKNQIGEVECLDLIAESINLALDSVDGVTAVIENTAGQGGSVGYRFEHLAALIDGVHDQTRVGVCLDTCHAFAAGYDIRTPDTYHGVMEEFGRLVGFGFLRAMHINDSKSALGSRVDRHHSLGEGELGEEALRLIMNDHRLDRIPIILETIDPDRWEDEINYLYGLIDSGSSR
jgi:deoxyribonuclease-4